MHTPPTVDLIVVDDELAALALRGMLEYWGVRVVLHLVATGAQLVAVLDGSTTLATHVVIMCHGVERGLHLPQLAPQIARGQPYVDAIGAAEFARFLRLPGRVVVNTGCSLGTADYAAAFLGAGCRAYCGATGDPLGSAAQFYAAHLCYELFCRQTPLADAHAKAMRHDADTQMFALYTAAAE